jgi:hypothetical protein
MQRSAGSTRMIRRGARFVSPAAAAHGTRLLSRTHSRITPRVPRAARLAAVRDPLAAVVRSARSLDRQRAARAGAHVRIRTRSMRWTAPRRALHDPRSFRAVSQQH